jgi:hypothetical protein
MDEGGGDGALFAFKTSFFRLYPAKKEYLMIHSLPEKWILNFNKLFCGDKHYPVTL